MAKTRDAVKILNRVTGYDQELRHRIAVKSSTPRWRA